MANNNNENAKSTIRIHITITSCLLAFFVLLFVMSFNLGGTAGKVPLLMSGAAVVLSLFELFGLVKEIRSREAGKQPLEPVAGLKWYYSIIIVIAYIVILMQFGFIASTLIYLFICPAILGYRKWHINALFSFIMTTILYVSFVKLFMVRLPIGIIISNLLGR